MKGKIKMALRKQSTITNKDGTSTHVNIKIKSTEAKAFVMKQYGWTKEEYNKKYDILRNKLRSYEAFLTSQGVPPKKKQSVADLLYKEAKAKKRYGKAYEESITMKRIKGFTSVSSGKKLQQALTNKKYVAKRTELFKKGTDEAFKGFIKANKQAKEIYDKIKNPFIREQALRDYANQLHIEISRSQKISKENAIKQSIPFGQSVGSPSAIDFDISDYEAWDNETK